LQYTICKSQWDFLYINNQVVGTGLTFSNPSDIGSGQKVPFELLLTSETIPNSEIDHYNLVAGYD